MNWTEAFKAIMCNTAVRRATWLSGSHIRRKGDEIVWHHGARWIPTHLVQDMEAKDWETYTAKTYVVRVGAEVFTLEAETGDEAVVKCMSKNRWICTGPEGIPFAACTGADPERSVWCHGYVVWEPEKSAMLTPRVVWLANNT